MSGDVQPRRRKDKKRKRDDHKPEGEVIFSRKQSLQEDDESSHGVHSANMGVDDQHLHVHEDHGTGGNWYQKCAFIVLMAILLGLVGLIIVENRGLADLDTPLSESRYSEYLHGWVEEHREEHDDHDEVQASIEEHDEHDEPFEEEEDHSEAEEEDEDEHDDDHDDDDEDDEEHDKDDDAEEASEEATAEQTKEVDDEEDDDEDDDDDANNDDDDDDDEQVDASQADDDDDEDDDGDNDDEIISKEADDDDDNATNEDDDDDNAPNTAEDDNDDDDVAANDDDDDDNEDDENNTEEVATAASLEADDNNDDDNDEDDDENEEDDDNNDVSDEPSHQASASRHSKANDFDDPFDEEDDDGTAESFENIVVDNDAEERLLLQEKERRRAEQNQPPKDDKDEDEPEEPDSFFANLAVKIGVGVALALVARFVLMRKNPNTNAEPSAEDLMKRRLTISSAEVMYTEDEDAPPLSEDEEQHASGEELEMEEEIEYVEEEEEIEIELDENDQEITPKISPTTKYVPETFEDFNAMYRPKNFVAPESSAKVEDIKTVKAAKEQEAPITMKKSAAVFTAPPPPPLVEAKMEPKQNTVTAKVSFSDIEPVASTKPSASPTETTTREVTHDIDFQPDEDDIDYTDEDEDYDEDEEIVEEEEEEIEDLLDDDGSDVDDTELMNRLEAKYGRLPTNEYESDEDPEDPTWTQIKPKQTPGGGPQTQEDDYHSIYNKIRQEPKHNLYQDDEYEREMAFANDELFRGNHIDALIAYFRITHNYPDRPMGFLGKAKLTHYLGKMKDDTGFMLQSVDAYKRYLAFDDLITNNTQFREAAEACIETMRTLGQLLPSLAIHRILIKRFQNDPELRNQMVITYLMMDRNNDAKNMLFDTLKNWPKNGFALTLLGYVLKTHDANYTGATHYLQQGLDSNAQGTQDARFYIALGESYERLGEHAASFEIYKRGAELKLYPSVYQRSVYNVLNLRAQPIWTEEQTTYAKNVQDIATHWQVIRDEALEILEVGGYFRKETENLVAIGNWKELELFARGVRHQRNCQRAPTTCWLIEQFPAAANCRRGQVKFSIMHPGTHVRPHCGPTNCRLRAHLGLIVPLGTQMRVASQNMTWTEGAFLIFDDSFEHEVWHDGEQMRLILIVDFWHPDLTPEQIARLSTI